MPWSFDVALVSLIFIAVGDLLREKEFFNRNYIYTLVLPFLVWIGIMLFTRLYIELAVRSYPAGIFSILEAIAGSLVLIAISKFWAQSLPLADEVAWIGRNSMIILGIHCIEIMYFNWSDRIFAYLPFKMTWISVFMIKSIVIIAIAKIIEILWLIVQKGKSVA